MLGREGHGSLCVVIDVLPIAAKLRYHGRKTQSKGMAEGVGKLGGQPQPIVGTRQGLVGVAQEPQRTGCIGATGDAGVFDRPETRGNAAGPGYSAPCPPLGGYAPGAALPDRDR